MKPEFPSQKLDRIREECFMKELAKNIVSLVSDENRLGFITTLENRIGSDETTVLLKK